MDPSDRDRVRELLRQRTSGEIDEVRYTWRGLRKDGELRQIETLGRRTMLRTGRPRVAA